MGGDLGVRRGERGKQRGGREGESKTPKPKTKLGPCLRWALAILLPSQRRWLSAGSVAVLFVSISQVIGCEDRLRNDLYCVEWGVKLYSNVAVACALCAGGVGDCYNAIRRAVNPTRPRSDVARLH